MEPLVLIITRKGFFMAIVHHVELTTDDRFYLGRTIGILVLPGFCHELERPEHVAVVRDRQRGLPIVCRLLIQRRYAGRTI